MNLAYQWSQKHNYLNWIHELCQPKNRDGFLKVLLVPLALFPYTKMKVTLHYSLMTTPFLWSSSERRLQYCYCIASIFSSLLTFLLPCLFLFFSFLLCLNSDGFIWDSVFYNNNKNASWQKISVWFIVLGINKD